MDDPLVSAVNGITRSIRGLDTAGMRAGEALGESVSGHVDAIENIVSLLGDVIDRLLAVEARLAAVEARDREAPAVGP